MIYTVRDITLRGKERVIQQRARIALDKNGLFLVMDSDGERIIMHADRGRVESVIAHGIIISCVIGTGTTKTGMRRYEHREIYCAYEVIK